MLISFFSASCISGYPGSEIQGVHASDTKAIFFHSSNNQIILSSFATHE